MKEETGIEADALTTLHTHVTFKNEHVYVIHVARAPDGVAPRPSRELTQFKWMRDFANDFGTETKEAVHRRVLDDEFLTAANAIHGNIARGAEAARRAVHVHATPTPTAAPHQLPHPSQPNARREHQHANAPAQTHPNRRSPTAGHSASDDAVTAYLDYVAATTKRAPDVPRTDANDARSDTSASPRTKTPRILHPLQQPPTEPTTTRLPHTQQQPQTEARHPSDGSGTTQTAAARHGDGVQQRQTQLQQHQHQQPPQKQQQLDDDHYQYAWPAAVQVGRLLNEPQNHYVYDPHRGPVATIRANMFKAEGPGRNTGLIIDEIGPRRITPTECARVHGFDTKPIQHLTPHQIYSLIGNSVTVHMARTYLQYFDRVLR